MESKALRFEEIIKKSGKVFIVALPILSVLYFFWVYFRIPLIFYLHNYFRTISYMGLFTLLAVSILTLATIIIARNRRVLGIIVLIVSTPLCCLSNIFTLYLPTILDTAHLSNETYFLTGEHEIFDARSFHYLYKCTDIKFDCERIPFWEGGGGSSFWPIHLMIDNNEVHVMYTLYDNFTRLEYTYGVPSRHYEFPEQLEDSLFYLAYYQDAKNGNLRTYLLYKCHLDNTNCTQLPFKYQGSEIYANVEADEVKKEIKVFIDSEVEKEILIYIYGAHPRCFVDGCEILDE